MSAVVLVLGVVSDGEVGGWGEIVVHRGHPVDKLAVDVISWSPK